MAIILANDVLEYTMFGTLYGQQILNVFHYRYSGANVPAGEYEAELDALSDEITGTLWPALGGGLQSLVTIDYKLVRVRLQPVWPTRRYYIDNVLNQEGTAVGAAAPANMAQAITLKTDRAVKGGQGRKHISGRPIGTISMGEWTAAGTLAVQTWAPAIMDPVDGTAPDRVLTPTVWSPRIPTSVTRILSVETSQQMRTMHRRTVGLGI